MKTIEEKITILKDKNGTDYLGCHIPFYKINDILTSFKLYHLHDDEYLSKLLYYKNLRDGNSYHLTILPVYEYVKVINEVKSILNKVVTIDMLGIGKAEKNNNEAHFIVAKSLDIDTILDDLKIERKDLHITIGFYEKDVFGVPKNETTIYHEIK
jgi:hypothetical protein